MSSQEGVDDSAGEIPLLEKLFYLVIYVWSGMGLCVCGVSCMWMVS